jgi:hypothetical protein
MFLISPISKGLPIILPFVIGLLVGVIIRQSIKMMISFTILVAILVFTGYLSLTFQDVFNQVMINLSKLIQTGTGLIEVLLNSTTTFLIGLLLGFWKG